MFKSNFGGIERIGGSFESGMNDLSGRTGGGGGGGGGFDDTIVVLETSGIRFRCFDTKGATGVGRGNDD
jgi:hypothetical protein